MRAYEPTPYDMVGSHFFGLDFFDFQIKKKKHQHNSFHEAEFFSTAKLGIVPVLYMADYLPSHITDYNGGYPVCETPPSLMKMNRFET